MLHEVAVSEIKSVSAAKVSRGSGQTRQRRRSKRDAANILWRRVTASYDEEVVKFAKNPALTSPITRWVLFNHLTPTQGMAGRRYADIVGAFRRFHTEDKATSARSANLEPVRNVDDQELQHRLLNGSMDDYESEARHARRQYKRLMKVLDQFKQPLTGRNYAKDALDDLCLADREPPSNIRGDIAVVLTAVAREFGLVKEKR